MSSPDNHRYAYVKFNNAVAELRRIESMGLRNLDGGPEAYVANFLDIVGNQPLLLISCHRTPPINESLKRNNVKLYSFYWSSGLSIKTVIRRLLVSARLFLMLLRFRPTRLLCSQDDLRLRICFAVCRILGIGLVYSRHTRLTQSDDRWHRRLFAPLDHWIMRRATAVISHGPYLKQQLLEIGVIDSRIIEFSWGFQHMFLEPTDELRMPGDITDGGRSSIVLYVGRMEHLKGVFDLLEACSGRLLNGPDTKLVYAGGGTGLAKLKERIIQLGLEKKAICLGRIAHNKLTHIICQSSVLVTPTRREFPEGRCMATMEGLVFGVPVIAPNFGPFPFLVKHGTNGLLFEPNSISDLRHAIESVLNDEKLYMTLKKGAKQTGLELRKPTVTFREAVERAFELADIAENKKVEGRSTNDASDSY
jgi:glycosyltransferase involved in cell wall biosynthesis